jgi:hypothetical protein
VPTKNLSPDSNPASRVFQLKALGFDATPDLEELGREGIDHWRLILSCVVSTNSHLA